MGRIKTIEKRYDLSRPFIQKVPWRVANFAISDFTGNSARTLIRFHETETETEQQIRLRWGLSGLVDEHGNPGLEMWIVNEIAQPNRVATFLFSEEEISIQTGAETVMIENPETFVMDVAGVRINPATKEKQILIDAAGHGQVDVLTSALPVDAATEATLAALRNRLNEQSGILDSTTATLLANAIYTGAAFSIAGWGRLIGTCFASHAGTLRVEQRQNIAGFTAWDVVSEFPCTAGASMGFSVEVVAAQAEVVFVNSATNQTSFRLSVGLRRV